MVLKPPIANFPDSAAMDLVGKIPYRRYIDICLVRAKVKYALSLLKTPLNFPERRTLQESRITQHMIYYSESGRSGASAKAGFIG